MSVDVLIICNPHDIYIISYIYYIIHYIYNIHTLFYIYYIYSMHYILSRSLSSGWLQSFVVKDMEVLTSAGALSLSIFEGQVWLAGGQLRLEEPLLHRTGKSGGTYTYAAGLRGRAEWCYVEAPDMFICVYRDGIYIYIHTYIYTHIHLYIYIMTMMMMTLYFPRCATTSC